jgi:hypothetical protein
MAEQKPNRIPPATRQPHNGRQQPGPREITHPSGLTFKVIPADSYDARIARDRRQLVMTDGTEWTVGTRGFGTALAWRPAVTA